ncbi:MAG: class I SAM-dependent methyltransferase [Alphaproteobacteria bacterium]|nr:class I SAM-dependent methyltransferase [Alphaproteobacteria bacterium]
MTFRAASRRLALGLSTALGVSARGVFVPYRHAREAKTAPGYAALLPRFAAAAATMVRVLHDVDRFDSALSAIGGGPDRARWNQDWFPRLDAAAAYALVRRHAPARIVEIGAGHSTRFLARATADGGLATRHLAIDPRPRAPLPPGVAHMPVALEEADPALFEGLAAGDVLFVDSSHVLLAGSDVDLILNGILPRLPGGALVHIHDIFLPDAYPRAWAWRRYNEQSAVAALLQGGAYEIVFASHYAVTRLAPRVASSAVARLPLVSGAHESSLWLRKVA